MNKRIFAILLGFALVSTPTLAENELVKQLDFLPPANQLNAIEVLAGFYHHCKVSKEDPDFDSSAFLLELQRVKPTTITALKGLKTLPNPDACDAFVGRMMFTMGDRYPVTEPQPVSNFKPVEDFFITKLAAAKPDEPQGDPPVFIVEEPSLKLRRNLDEASKSSEDALGALLSFSRNNISDTDTWIFRGALIHESGRISNDKHPDFLINPPLIQQESLLGAITWDKVDVSGTSAGQVDSLDFDLQYSALWDNNPLFRPDVNGGFFGRGRANASFGYNTDFDFDHHLFKTEVDYIPYFDLFDSLSLNEGYYTRIPFVKQLTADLRFHSEGGIVENDGDSRMLLEEGFLRVGGKATITLWPELPTIPMILPNGNSGNYLSLFASYFHYETVISSMESPYVFETGLNWRIRPETDLVTNLSVSYRQGQVEDTLQDVDLFTIGLSVAF